MFRNENSKPLRKTTKCFGLRRRRTKSGGGSGETRTGCLVCPRSCSMSRCGTWPSPVRTETPYTCCVHTLLAMSLMCDCPLSLTGSHDSMSFCLDVSSPVLKSESCILRLIDRLFPCWTRTCVSRWATTQVQTTHTHTHRAIWPLVVRSGAVLYLVKSQIFMCTSLSMSRQIYIFCICPRFL